MIEIRVGIHIQVLVLRKRATRKRLFVQLNVHSFGYMRRELDDGRVIPDESRRESQIKSGFEAIAQFESHKRFEAQGFQRRRQIHAGGGIFNTCEICSFIWPSRNMRRCLPGGKAKTELRTETETAGRVSEVAAAWLRVPRKSPKNDDEAAFGLYSDHQGKIESHDGELGSVSGDEAPKCLQSYSRFYPRETALR